MANQPGQTSVFTLNGYAVFGVKDSSGNAVAAFGNYVWNPNVGTAGLWVPAPVDANGVPQMSLAGSNALFNGTYTVTATGAAIAASQACTEVLVQNDPDSQGAILVGGSNAQTIKLAPGQSKVYQVSNVDIVWAKFAANTTSATLNWEAKS